MKKKNNNGSFNNIERAIIRVIAFFDLFDHPLTAREVWSYMDINGLSLREVWNFLDSGTKAIECKHGFYFLRGREETVETRRRRFNYSLEKIKKATKAAKYFSIFPWIKMVAISNIIGSYNLRKDGDIDLLIVTQRNRVWISRFFCVLTAMIFGWRPKPGKEKDKICLNFFISEDACDLDVLRCHKEDIYLIFWMVGLFPIYNADHAYERFIKANEWIKEELPNWRLKIRSFDYYRERPLIWVRFFESVLGKFENASRRLQLKIMPSQLKELMNKDTRVMVDKRMIKLHTKDRRLTFQKDFDYNYQRSLDLLR